MAVISRTWLAKEGNEYPDLLQVEWQCVAVVHREDGDEVLHG